MKLATNVTVPTIIIPTSIVIPLYGPIVWASEAFAVLVDMPVEVAELEVAAAVAGTEESFASVCNQSIVVSPFYSYQIWNVGTICNDADTLTACSKVPVQIRRREKE